MTPKLYTEREALELAAQMLRSYDQTPGHQRDSRNYCAWLLEGYAETLPVFFGAQPAAAPAAAGTDSQTP